MVKNTPANAGDVRDSVSIPGSGRSPGEGNGNPLQYWHVCMLGHVHLFATPWTIAHQTPLSIGFSRQEYWSGLPFPSPGDLSNPGIKTESLVSPALASGFFTNIPPGKPTPVFLPENSMDREVWWALVHGVAKSWT